MLQECFKIFWRNSKWCLPYCEDDPSVSLIPWVFSFAESECVCGGRLISKEMKDLRWPVFLDWHSHHTHTHRYSVRCVTGERISAGPLHSNACVLPHRSPLSGWSSSSQDVPVKDVDYLSFFFTTLTGARTLAYTHRSYITFNDTSTDSMLDIDKTAFPWSCASGFSSEMLRALQDTDEDGLLPSSTLSPLSVFATTLEQFLHHWDVVEVILSLSLLSDSPFLHFQLLQHVCYVSCSAVNRCF